MRELFAEYYMPADEDIRRAWKEGIISFDTNVLLNLYREKGGADIYSNLTTLLFPSEIKATFIILQQIDLLAPGLVSNVSQSERVLLVEEATRIAYNPLWP